MKRNQNQKKSRPPRKDPYLEREAAKYDRPVPSREYILQWLDYHGTGVKREQLYVDLKAEDEEAQEAIRRRLRAMERDGQIIYTRNGFAPVDALKLVRGRVVGHPDGFGFLIPDEGGEDLYLSARDMERVLHGDRVLARVIGVDRRGRREGRVVEVLERANTTLVGRYFEESGIGFVAPENRRIAQDILIPPGNSKGAKHGQIVNLVIKEQPDRHRQAVGQVVEIVGDHMAPGMEIDIAIRAYGLPHEWPDAVLNEIEAYSEQVPEKDKKGRTDLRDVPLVTIDGEDARDFDDAVYCCKTPKGWRLLVAIADVSHYVKPGTALDEEAKARGNSVYFPEQVIPMLPEILSNGLCSLNPKVDRLCMVCEIYFDAQGKILRSRFFEGLMRSHARLTYTQVAQMLVERKVSVREQYESLVPHLEDLHDLYKVLAKARKKRGAIDFDTTETKIVFGEDRKIETIVPVVRNDAHKLIEECMIAANVCAARFLQRHKIPGLYRVHEPPDGDKLEDLRSFLAVRGLALKGGERPKAKDFARIMEQLHGREDAHLIQTVMLRSLKQAQYHPENIGHFGLAHEAYAHFTSPIRRYPDLLVHRAIRHLVRGKKVARFPYQQADMISLGEHSSMTERRADEATRDAVSWLKCEYMLDKVGEQFEGLISSVTGFGLFVELKDIYVEGLVHISNLPGDYYEFDPINHRLVGERSGRVFRLGDPLKVQVTRVDLDERKIDFELLEAKSPSDNKPKSKRKSKRGKTGTARDSKKPDGGKKRRGKGGRRRKRQ